MENSTLYDTERKQCVRPMTGGAGATLGHFGSIGCCLFGKFSLKKYTNDNYATIWMDSGNQSYCITIEGMPYHPSHDLRGQQLVLKEGKSNRFVECRFGTLKPLLELCSLSENR